jgi:hypothetical protein
MESMARQCSLANEAMAQQEAQGQMQPCESVGSGVGKPAAHHEAKIDAGNADRGHRETEQRETTTHTSCLGNSQVQCHSQSGALTVEAGQRGNTAHDWEGQLEDGELDGGSHTPSRVGQFRRPHGRTTTDQAPAELTWHPGHA